MLSKYLPPLIYGFLLFLFAGSAYAHARLKLDSITPPRYTYDSITTDPINVPCGNIPIDNSVTTGRISIFQANQTIMIDWEETIDHDSNYFVEFSPANDKGFEDVANLLGTFNIDQSGASRSNPNNYQAEITLPDQTCEACTLRIRQFISSRNSNYLSCADIVLVSGQNITPPSMAINTTAIPNDNTVILNWENPVENNFKAVVVTRSMVVNSDVAKNRTHYLVNDTIGSASTVVYRGNGSTFSDSGLTAETTYYYKVFTYDNDYNYSQATTISAITNAPANPGSGASSGGSNNDSGGGSIFLFLFALIIALCTRSNILRVKEI